MLYFTCSGQIGKFTSTSITSLSLSTLISLGISRSANLRPYSYYFPSFSWFHAFTIKATTVEKMRKQVHIEARRPWRAEERRWTRAAEGCSSRTGNTAQSGSAVVVSGSFRCWEEGSSRFLRHHRRRWMREEVVRSRYIERVEAGSSSTELLRRRRRRRRKEERVVEDSCLWKEMVVVVKVVAEMELGCKGCYKRNTLCTGSARVTWLLGSAYYDLNLLLPLPH